MTPPRSEPNHTRAVFLAGGVIALAGLIAYGNSFSAPFVFDSATIIAYNPTIHHLGTAWRPPHDGSTVDGRPLLNLSLAVNYAISGTQVWSYHALNLLIHVLAGLTLFGVARRTLRWSALPPMRLSTGDAAQRIEGKALHPLIIAFAVALLWTLHPLQTDAVTYVIQRAESMMGLFYLLTLYCFIRGAEEGNNRQQSAFARRSRATADSEAGGGMWFWFSVVCCLLGMATKEVMVSAPVIVFLYDRTFLSGSFRKAWQRHKRAHLRLAATWILLTCLEIGTTSRHGTAGFGVNLHWPAYVATQIYAVAHYLRLTFWPRSLAFDYGTALVTQPARVIPAAIVVALLLAGTLVALVRRPALGFLGAWFFAILAPTCLVPVATQTIAEHRMYLPLAALMALAVVGIARWAGRASLPIFLAAAAGLGAATIHRNQTYLSEVALWTNNVAVMPGNARAHNNLGKALYLMGDAPEAAEQYTQALRLQPDDNPEVQYNLGLCFLQEGRWPEAISRFSEALHLAPENADAHLSLGNAFAQSGRLQEAMEQYRTALQINPDFADAHYNLGNIWLMMGRKPEAIAEYEAALRINPDFADARASLDHLQAAPGAH